MKTENRSPLQIAAVSCAGLLVVGCLCAAVFWLAGLSSLGDLWQAAVELFRPGPPAEASLYRVLRENGEASFRLGEGCEYTYTQGSIIDSTLESGEFAREMGREQVVQAVTGSLQEDIYRVQDGEIHLDTGEPVRATLLEESQVSMSLRQQIETGEGPAVRSLEGVVDGSRLRGSFHLEQNISTVVNGQGIEKAITIAADLACPLQWRSP
jgi:hypothetical protein